jgi:hypothetical protein
MTIFRRKNMASLFSSIKKNISIKKHKATSSPTSSVSSMTSQSIRRQKVVLDFTAYFADQDSDAISDDVMVTEDVTDVVAGDLRDDVEDDKISVTVGADDNGSILVTVVPRCRHDDDNDNDSGNDNNGECPHSDFNICLGKRCVCRSNSEDASVVLELYGQKLADLHVSQH